MPFMALGFWMPDQVRHDGQKEIPFNCDTVRKAGIQFVLARILAAQRLFHRFLNLPGELRHDIKEITDDPKMGHVENGGLGVVVNRDDDIR